MPKREYTGEALDHTVTHLAELEEPGGESRDSGSLNVDVTKEGRKKERIIRFVLNNPGHSLREIGSATDSNHAYVWEVLENRKNGPYEKYRHGSWEDYPETAKEIIKLHRSGVYDTKSKIADRCGVSGAYVTQVLKANQHLTGVSDV